MTDKGDKNIRVGNISGTGIAVGHGAQAEVTITQQSRDEIIGLLEQLRKDIANASIPDSTKNVLLNKAVPEMAQAIRSTDPKSGLERGFERINDHLEGVGAVASNVSGIIETVTKIAKTAGIVIKTVAPFLSALL
jgi:hypothetical protein